jgi:hypothetical protein
VWMFVALLIKYKIKNFMILCCCRLFEWADEIDIPHVIESRRVLWGTVSLPFMCLWTDMCIFFWFVLCGRMIHIFSSSVLYFIIRGLLYSFWSRFWQSSTLGPSSWRSILTNTNLSEVTILVDHLSEED